MACKPLQRSCNNRFAERSNKSWVLGRAMEESLGKSYKSCCKDGISGNQSACRSFENPLVDQTLWLKKQAGTATACRVSCTACVSRWPKRRHCRLLKEP